MNSVLLSLGAHLLVLTGLLRPSQNSKTGPMVQSYLLDPTRIKPEPKVFGARCETCPMVQRCYVSRDKLSVRKAVVENKYPQVQLTQALNALEGKKIRLGTYGDPSVIPLETLGEITRVTSGHTGYTHYWSSIDNGYSRYLMASVESVSLKEDANKLGYRTFRVLPKGEPITLEDDEILCPNYSHGVQCHDCGLCDGKRGDSDRRKSIAIPEH